MICGQFLSDTKDRLSLCRDNLSFVHYFNDEKSGMDLYEFLLEEAYTLI